MHPQRESPGGTNYHRAQSFLQSVQTAGGVGHTHRGGAWTEGEEGDEEVDASSPVTAQHVTSPPRRLRLCLSRADLEMAPSGSRHPSAPLSQLRKRRLREAKQLARARSPLSFQVAKQDSNPGLGLHVHHGGAAWRNTAAERPRHCVSELVRNVKGEAALTAATLIPNPFPPPWLSSPRCPPMLSPSRSMSHPEQLGRSPRTRRWSPSFVPLRLASVFQGANRPQAPPR